jgi:F0F1-type ATP synthase assembly protein I
VKAWLVNAVVLGVAFGIIVGLIERSPPRGLIGGALFGVLIATYAAWRKWPSIVDRIFRDRGE